MANQTLKTKSFKELISEGEKLRETDPQASLQVLEEAYDLAIKNDNYKEGLEALGHIFIYHKNSFQFNERHSAFAQTALRKMHEITIQGIKMALEKGVNGEPLSVMYLRLADTMMGYGNLKEAERYYQKALLDLVSDQQASLKTVAEYKGHLAFVKAKMGQYAESLRITKEALKDLELYKSAASSLNAAEQYRLLSSECGIWLRLAEIRHDHGDRSKAEEALGIAEEIAAKIKRLGMPLRSKQVLNLRSAWKAERK